MICISLAVPVMMMRTGRILRPNSAPRQARVDGLDRRGVGWRLQQRAEKKKLGELVHWTLLLSVELEAITGGL